MFSQALVAQHKNALGDMLAISTAFVCKNVTKQAFFIAVLSFSEYNGNKGGRVAHTRFSSMPQYM